MSDERVVMFGEEVRDEDGGAVTVLVFGDDPTDDDDDESGVLWGTLISRDPDMRQRLRELVGKHFTLELPPTNGCTCERGEWVRQSAQCPLHGRDCYECGKPVAEGEGEQHGRAGFAHFTCVGDA